MRGTLIGESWILLVAPLIVSGCGGSSGGSLPVTVILDGDASLDGFADDAGGAASTGGFTGDFDSIFAGIGARQFFSFDLTVLPPGITVTQATLQIDQQSIQGTPYATHGVVVIDHLDYGMALDGGDFNAAALQSNVGTISADATIGVKALDVTANVQADLSAARVNSQYRARFTLIDTDNDGVDDFVIFVDSGQSNVGGQIPHLVVSYIP